MRVGFEPKSLGKKIEKIPQKYVLIVMIVLVVAVLAGLYYFLMMPQLEKGQSGKGVRRSADATGPAQEHPEEHR